MEKILNYIDGAFVEPANRKYMDNVNPAVGTTYSLVPDSDEADVQLALEAAERAFPSWSKTPVAVRSKLLREIGHRIGQQLDALAMAESKDNGKPVHVARTLDIPRGQANMEFFADAITQFHGDSFQMDDRGLNYTTYSPLGVVVCISPWNLPLYLFTWKIAPALAAGNTVVAKPSEMTPMTAYLFCKIAQEVGLPKGVFNVLHGRGSVIGTPLVSSEKVRAVSFTGSTATGRSISKATAGQFKKLSLEMGGKNANIIFADCNFEKALNTTLRSSFANQGQICLCGSRILVERSIYNKFRDALVEKTKKLKVGDPTDPKTDLGALVSEAHMQKVLSYFELARKEGGTILCGGRRAEMSGAISKGYYVEPTLIEGLSASCRTNQEEIFGPVATLVPFDSEQEAVAMANATPYGLSASVWTENTTRAHRVAQGIHTGIVWINAWMLRDLRIPFGGVKESGIGREGGTDSLRFFSEVKNICVGLEET